MTGARNVPNDSTKAQKMSGSLSQSLSQLRKKAPKGNVSVQVFKDRLRLCWSYCRKRYFLYMGLPDSKVNRIVAQQKAKQIEGDMATGNFDLTLKKYKIDQQRFTKTTVSKLFEQFTAEKAKDVTPKTIEKYRATLGYLNRYFGDTPAHSVDSSKAEDFARHLHEKRLSLDQCKRRLEELKACWNWAIAKNSIEPTNPWTEVAKRVKVPPKQKPKPFTKKEIEQIEQGFRSDRHYSYYADFVQFLFGTGCRTGEAIGLKWKHISDNCSSVWIGESVSRRIRKSTKTNRDRTIGLSP